MRRSCWAVCALLAACGPGAIPGGPGIAGGPVAPPRGNPTGLTAAGPIGPAGGSVKLIASDGGSLTATVPPGALAATINFTIDEIVTDPLVLLGATGKGYRLGPAATPLLLPMTLAFSPPPLVSPAGLTAAIQAAVGYWFRVYAVTRDATSVSAQTTFFGDWSLVTLATQRDLRGTFTLSSTEGPSFGTTGAVTLQYLGGDATSGAYLPQGTITLTVPVTVAAGVTCTPALAAMDLPVSIAEVSAGKYFRWGINGEWELSCTDASKNFVSTNFDTLGITNRGCTRAYTGAFTISTTLVQGTYLIDCGTAGTVTATWSLGP